MPFSNVLAGKLHRSRFPTPWPRVKLVKEPRLGSIITFMALGTLFSFITSPSEAGFITTPLYATGAHPRAVAVADFNGDSILDLVTVNEASGTVSVLLGNGDGSFQSAQSYAVGSDPRAVALGDFNGDGHIDLVVVNYGDFFGKGTGISVLLGNGDGTFQAAQTYAPGLSSTAVAVGDFNRDNVLDLAVGSDSNPSGTLSILLGNGDGSFQDPQSYAAGSNPVSMVVGDFNGDGNADVAVADAGTPSNPGSTVLVLLGNGDGTLQVAQSYDGGPRPSSLAVGDFNQDGIPDLVVADAGVSLQPGGTVSVLMGNGDGTFQASQSYAVPGTAHAVAVGDLNGDGIQDLAVAEDSGVSILLGNGDGTFQAPHSYYAAGPYPYSLAVGDFNADTHLDLAVANFNPDPISPQGTVSIFLGHGDGTFQAAQSDAFGTPQPTSVALGDLNGDGIADLAVGLNDLSTVKGSVQILLGNGDGTFQAGQSYRTGNNPFCMLVADLNRDGILDLVAVCSGMIAKNGTVNIFLGNGDGTFQTGQVYNLGYDLVSAGVGDFNGDGILDLMVVDFGAHFLPSGVSILLGNGDGTFQAPQTYSVGSQARSVAVGDFNGDGISDLALANNATGTVSVLLANGDGTFQAPQDYAVGSFPVSVVAGDFNGDLILDLAVLNSSDSTVSILLGNRDGSFQPARTYAVGSSPQSMAVGDFNADGILDLAVGSVLGMNILLGNGDGTFQAAQTYAAGSLPISLAVGDLNGDKLPDIVVANRHDYPNGTITILLNK